MRRHCFIFAPQRIIDARASMFARFVAFAAVLCGGAIANGQPYAPSSAPNYAPNHGPQYAPQFAPTHCDPALDAAAHEFWKPGVLLHCVCDSVWPPSCLRHSTNTGRHVGKGEPLGGSSWLNRPWHVGWFAGAVWPGDPIDGEVEMTSAFLGGYQIGYDFDHFWGAQIRFGGSAPRTKNLVLPGPETSGRIVFLDVDLVYYPWGDSRIRPYFLLGLGGTQVKVYDATETWRSETLFSVPIGVGVKHHFRRWLSVKLELVDNIVAGSGHISSMHNVALLGGVEVHFGARPKSYWPWTPSRHIW